MNLSALNKIRCRFLDQSTGMPVPGVIASLSVGMGSATKSARLPVGTLCTDATGYMSFDLKPVNLQFSVSLRSWSICFIRENYSNRATASCGPVAT